MLALRFVPGLAFVSLVGAVSACADEPAAGPTDTAASGDTGAVTAPTEGFDAVAADGTAPDAEAADGEALDSVAADTIEVTPEVVDPCAGRECGDVGGQSCGRCDGERVCSAAGRCRGWRAIASQGGDLCGVLEDGTIDCREGWPHRLPAGADYVDVAVGSAFVCGLTTDGGIRCSGKDPGDTWGGGEKDFGPAGDSWVQVSAGDVHYCARDASARISCWGKDAWGEVKDAPTSGLYVDAGHERTCVVGTNHLASCVGRDDGDLAVPAAMWATIMAANFRHACGTLNVGGAVLCWGDSAGDSPSGAFVQVVAKNSDGATCGLRTSGGMICWNTGFGSHSYDGDFSDIAIDQNQVCGLGADGSLTCESIDGF